MHNSLKVRIPSRGRLFCIVMAMHAAGSCSLHAQEDRDAKQVRMQQGSLSAVFRSNETSPVELSGIQTLINTEDAPGVDAFDPDTKGASAGLNFEHIISGHKSPNNKFTPRHGPYRLHVVSKDTVKLIREAKDSPWLIDSELEYKLVAPHYVDFHFRCIPRDASKFGERGYAIFFFAHYMNDVIDASLNFLGKTAVDQPVTWVTTDAPNEHADWNGGGNYRSISADDLKYDDDVEFRLNTWSYDWPRIAKPFYFGKAEKNMTLILMFDRLHSRRDQIRFSMYKFKLTKWPRPAWDFQYVINRVQKDQEYGFRGRLVWKKFVSQKDSEQEYESWRKSLRDQHVKDLRRLGAVIFLKGEHVNEVNANGTRISDRQLEMVSEFAEMTDLSLEKTQISDVGLTHLSNLQKLEWLNLYRCPITDAGLVELKHLGNLQHLPIGASKVTDAGLVHLSEMRQLVYLGLRANAVSDEGLVHLSELTKLQGLHLGETKITDAGLRHLKKMKKLKRLWLDQTDVTDACVVHLKALTSLVELHIAGTSLTDDGLGALRRAIPKCEVIR